LMITVYYVAIIGWSLYYAYSAIAGLAWGADPQSFFLVEYLQLSPGPFEPNGIVLKSFIPLILAWAIIYAVLRGGVQGGIEKANKVLMPILFAMVILIIIRGLTLPGAMAGLDYMFKPDLSKIGDPGTWIAAYGQVFFSLSVAFAIMITYSSYLPKKSDINNNAFLASFADCGFSLLAGISVFAILGYMAFTQGKEVAEVAGSGGVGLAFWVFPEAINALPGYNNLFGAIFFLVLAFAGFTSAISINEVVISAVSEKFMWSRKRTVTIVIVFAATVSILFTTRGGLHILDLVDHYVNDYNIVLGGLIEIILLGWFYKLVTLKEHANSVSDFKIGIWWDISLKYLTPIMLIIVAILKFKTDLTDPYSGYPQTAQLVFGWSVPILTIIFGIILSHINKNKQKQ
ncbi:MAG: sodium-dependent transporter, partial [Spirochaetales bacterium]